MCNLLLHTDTWHYQIFINLNWPGIFFLGVAGLGCGQCAHNLKEHPGTTVSYIKYAGVGGKMSSFKILNVYKVWPNLSLFVGLSYLHTMQCVYLHIQVGYIYIYIYIRYHLLFPYLKCKYWVDKPYNPCITTRWWKHSYHNDNCFRMDLFFMLIGGWGRCLSGGGGVNLLTSMWILKLITEGFMLC